MSALPILHLWGYKNTLTYQGFYYLLPEDIEKFKEKTLL